MGFLKKLALPIAAVFSLSLASGAEAATCSLTDVQTSTACIGAQAVDGTIGPNGSPDPTDIAGLGGFSDWSFVEKVEGDSFIGTTIKLTTLDGLRFSGDDDQKSGFWEIINANPLKTYALALKGGTEFAAYVLSGTDGGWTTAALTVPANNQHGLSNAVLFSRDAAPSGVIPVPAGLPLLLTALGFGGLIGRRRRRSA